MSKLLALQKKVKHTLDRWKLRAAKTHPTAKYTKRKQDNSKLQYVLRTGKQFSSRDAVRTISTML
jgi:hypothetical protein